MSAQTRSLLWSYIDDLRQQSENLSRDIRRDDLWKMKKSVHKAQRALDEIRSMINEMENLGISL